MNDPIEIPAKGQPMKAGWGASVANAVNRLTVSVPANMLVRYGAGGFGFAALPPNLRDRRGASTAFLHPWKVKGCTKGEDVDHLFEIYIPSGALHVGENEIEVEGVTGNVIDSEPTGDATLYLVIYRENGEEEGGEEPQPPKAKIVTTVSEGDGKIFAVIPIATVTVEEVGEGSNATTRGVVTAQHLTTAVGLPETTESSELGDCVTSLNDGTGDMDIIGGNHITVSVESNGKTIKISYDGEKEGDDPDPNEDDNPCDHPGNEDLSGGGAGGGGGVSGDGDELPGGAGDGCDHCRGSSQTGGSETGTPELGASGKEVSPGGTTPGTDPAPTAPNGKEVSEPPTSSGGSSGSGSSGKEIRPGSIEETQSRTKTPIYTGAHTPLTDTKKMNESPFKSDPNFKPIGSGTTTPIANTNPIYTGTHTQLTDTKKKNESPFKKDPNFRPIGS